MHTKQLIFRLSLSAALMIILIQFGVVNALFMFFVAGTLPGTDYVVPAHVMMLAYCAVICVVVFYSFAKDMLRTIVDRHLPHHNHATSPAKRRVKLI